jgi:hypothetical protein
MKSVRFLAAVAALSGLATAVGFASGTPKVFGSMLMATAIIVLVASVVVMAQTGMLVLIFRQAHAMQRAVAERLGSARVDDASGELPPRCKSCDEAIIGYTGAYHINDHGQVSLEEVNQPCGCRIYQIRFLGSLTPPRP